MLERLSKREAPVVKKEKTKEELAQLRRDMMKRRPVTAKVDTKEEEKPHPKAALMERLASGRRVEVSGKQMHKLTSKNYQELPEIKRKREEEAKKAEL